MLGTELDLLCRKRKQTQLAYVALPQGQREYVGAETPEQSWLDTGLHSAARQCGDSGCSLSKSLPAPLRLAHSCQPSALGLVALPRGVGRRVDLHTDACYVHMPHKHLALNPAGEHAQSLASPICSLPTKTQLLTGCCLNKNRG